MNSSFSPKKPSPRRLDRIFSFIETLRPSDRLILKLLLVGTLISTIWLLTHLNTSALVHVPKDGGTLTEGIVGTPRFINPLLAVTNADRDMTSLIYAGLMKLGADGVLVPDMAESIHVSDDGLIYNVVLKNNLTFHDGTPVTANDVIFSIARIQDPSLKSPLSASWEGVTTEYISDTEFNFVLEQPYEPFLENLTLGILPRHVWEFATAEEFPFSQFNSEPIGSGPYRIEKIVRNKSGIPESYILAPFEGYAGVPARIRTVELSFFANETDLVDALLAHDIDSAAGLSPESIVRLKEAPEQSGYKIYTSPLPRTFAIFFNQNEAPVLRDNAVRAALAAITPRERIVAEVLGGYGTAIEGPIPPGFGINIVATSTTPLENPLDAARDILRNGGWRFNEERSVWEKKVGSDTMDLSFSISTANAPMFQQTAEILKEEWGKLGIVIDVKKFEQTDLTQTIIRPRNYEALLFGTVVGRELDFFSFWHSSQRNDPGLNVALYANITTDSVLTKARTASSTTERQAAYQRFADELHTEIPAIFLYVPSFVYVAPPYISDINLRGVATANERFASIPQWYIETESVWPIFADDIQQSP